MKNKIFVFIGITILFSCFFTVKAHAQTLNQLSSNSKFMVYSKHETNTPGTYFYYIYTVPESIGHDEVTLNINNNSIYGLPNNSAYSWINQYWVLNEDPLLDLNKNYNVLTNNTLRSFSYSSSDLIIVLKGDVNITTINSNVFGSLNDYNDSIAPTWWDNVKQAFMDFVGSEALSDVLSGNWIDYIEDVLFGELWTVKVGEGEDDLLIPETVSATPTPSPTPIPTPIPYSTVIDPGTGEIHYHYTIDVSGTPVPTSSIYPPVTSSPPGPGSGSTIDEPVAVEDYYEPEDSFSVPKLRIFKFLLRMTGNDVDVGMDSLDDNMAVMDATLEDNAEAISGVGDLFQLIPVKWFILVGTLACFPVIAAMIKSLLGG